MGLMTIILVLFFFIRVEDLVVVSNSNDYGSLYRKITLLFHNYDLASSPQ